MSGSETYDVVVIGSGAAEGDGGAAGGGAGLLRAHRREGGIFGGTSATSGGVMWVPNHGLAGDDSREEALRYLDSIIDGPVRRDRLEAYVEAGPQMVGFLKSLGVEIMPAAWPDYFPEAQGARSDRSLVCPTFDGRDLGDKFTLMREQYTRFKLLNRYAMDLPEFFAISTRGKGWIAAFLKILWRYWFDLGTRRIGRRDRRFTSGAALMGQLYQRIFARAVEIRLGNPAGRSWSSPRARSPVSRSAASAATTGSVPAMASSSVPAASNGTRRCATASMPFRA